MPSSIDGLASGLSTSSMISSLMQVEAAPQTALKSKVSAAEKVVSAYMSVNSKLQTLKAAADDVSLLPTWRSIKPTSSSPSVRASAIGGTNTATGTLTFDVVSLAKAQINTARVAPSGPVTNADSFTVQIGTAEPVVVDITKDKSAQGIADALNARGIGVKASVVTTGGTQNILQFTGSNTGEANAFQVTGLEETGLAQVAAPKNAMLQVGGAEADGGYSVTSASNTFSGLIAGVAVTVGKEETGVTLSVAPDVSGIAAKFQALVDAANGALTEVAAQTKYDAATKKSSTLTGDFMVRQMSSTILSAVSQGLTFRKDGAPDAPDPKTATAQQVADDKLANVVNFGSLSKLGITLNRDGSLKFDEEKFTTAYNTDPGAIKAAGIAFADSFEALAKKQSENVTAAVTGRKTLIDSMNSRIENWDVRLAAKREALQKQYTGLESALSKLNSQSTWLSGQLAGLG